MFELGEKVIYPQFGLGTIEEVTQKQVGDTSLSFYRLAFPVKQMEILVPVGRAQENGLRKVMSPKDVDALLKCIADSSTPTKPQQWHRWRKKTLEQLKSGDPLEIAKIYCYLRSLEGNKGLSFTERKILMHVERMLISEIAVAKQCSEKHATRLIQKPSKAAAAANGTPKARSSAG